MSEHWNFWFYDSNRHKHATRPLYTCMKHFNHYCQAIMWLLQFDLTILTTRTSHTRAVQPTDIRVLRAYCYYLIKFSVLSAKADLCRYTHPTFFPWWLLSVPPSSLLYTASTYGQGFRAPVNHKYRPLLISGHLRAYPIFSWAMPSILMAILVY